MTQLAIELAASSWTYRVRLGRKMTWTYRALMARAALLSEPAVTADKSSLSGELASRLRDD